MGDGTTTFTEWETEPPLLLNGRQNHHLYWMGDRTTTFTETALFQNSHPMSVLKSVPYRLKIPLPLGLHYPHQTKQWRNGWKRIPWLTLGTASVCPTALLLSQSSCHTDITSAYPAALFQCQSCHTDIAFFSLFHYTASVSVVTSHWHLSSSCFTALLLSQSSRHTDIFFEPHYVNLTDISHKNLHAQTESVADTNWNYEQCAWHFFIFSQTKYTVWPGHERIFSWRLNTVHRPLH